MRLILKSLISILDPKATFQYVVAFNQLSFITNEGKFFTWVISLPKKIVLRIEGDDLWKVENQKMKFSDPQRKSLLELLR